MDIKLIRNQDIVWEEMDGQALLVHSSTGQRWTLNAAALTLWKLCDGTRTTDALANVLAALTQQSPKMCLPEWEHFAQASLESGLVQCAGAASNLLVAQPVHFSSGATLRALFHGKNLGGPRRRPSPRGNSGPG